MFHLFDQQSTSTGENINFDNLDFEATIPYIESAPTGILPTIQTIEADGTSRYFDLQGRMLNGKPNKGVYIENGKKVIR